MNSHFDNSKSFIAHAGSDGEVLITAPDGSVHFMGLLDFIQFVWTILRAGRKIEVSDD